MRDALIRERMSSSFVILEEPSLVLETNLKRSGVPGTREGSYRMTLLTLLQQSINPPHHQSNVLTPAFACELILLSSAKWRVMFSRNSG